MMWLDIVIVLFLGALFVIGLQRGIILTIFPVAGLALATILAIRFYNPVANSLSSWVESPFQSKILAFVVIFILVTAAAVALASIARLILALLFLGWLDRIGGGAFSTAVGGLVCAIVLFVLTSLHFSVVDDAIQASGVATSLLRGFDLMLAQLPRGYETIRHFFG